MNQTIDAAKLKAAAEHLEWVLNQYPNEPVVQGLLQSLKLLIDAAKAEQITEPMKRADIPCRYPFADGTYVPFSTPNVGNAYTDFSIQIRGGLTQQEREASIRIQSMLDELNANG